MLVAIAALSGVAHDVFVARTSTIREQVPTLLLMASLSAIIYWRTAEVLGLPFSQKGKVVRVLGAGGVITFGGFIITSGGWWEMAIGGLTISLGFKFLLFVLRHT